MALNSNSSAQKIPLWLDCDTGHDDAFALLLASHHPSIHLIGVSTVHGNASLTHTTPNTLAVLQTLGTPSTPLIRGSSRPLSRAPCFAPEYHGASGLDGVSLLPVPDAEKLANLRKGTQWIAEAVMQQPKGRVWIVATGPLTNVARILQETPELAGHIAGLSIMGGAIGSSFTNAPMHRTDGPGNWTPFAEFNIFCDPEAAQIIFSNEELAAKTTLIPLDLTHLVRGTVEVQDLLFGEEKNSHVRRMMKQVLMFFAETYRKHSGIEDGPPLHDPLAVWAVVRPEMFDDRSERWDVEVVLEGKEVGRTVATPARDGRGVRIPRGVDVGAFWGEIDMVLGEAERCVEV